MKVPNDEIITVVHSIGLLVIFLTISKFNSALLKCFQEKGTRCVMYPIDITGMKSPEVGTTCLIWTRDGHDHMSNGDCGGVLAWA